MFDDTENNPFQRSIGNNPLLTIVVHTASFKEAIVAKEEVVERLLRLGEMMPGRCRVVWTPPEDDGITWTLRRGHWTEVGEYEANDEWLVIKTQIPAPVRHRIAYLGDWRRPAEEGSRVTVLDELFTHPLPVDLFIVAEGDPFLKRDPRRRWYVCPDDAFNLVRILVTTLSSEDSYYLQFRASKLFPGADLPRVAMGIARTYGFPTELREQIESFRLRIELILRAADRVGYHALRRPDGRAAGKCSYHLGYFIMLVTGLFDELAWTVARRYNLKVSPQQTVLRQRVKNDAFFKAVQVANADAHAFLSDPAPQAIIRLFYPARDQLQHRALLPTRVVPEPRPARVLAELPDETLKEIQAVSTAAGTDWGLVDPGTGSAKLVDPYLFTLAAVDAVASVTNGLLKRLEWERYADLLPEDLREEKRNYFRTEIGTAPMTRFHDHPEPPYF